MDKQANQAEINNFFYSLDLSMPMVHHFRNAMRDARLYKWNSATVIAIMMRIEQAYLKTKQEV